MNASLQNFWMNARGPVLFLVVALIPCMGCRKSVQSSAAMAPTIKAGERVTIDYLAYAFGPPRRWDVVVLEPPPGIIPAKTRVLKRVIALPMETISLTSSGIVVNGSAVRLPAALSNVVYCAPEHLPANQLASLIRFPYSVPTNHYFVVGDNWANSYDSRFFGAVPATNIFGRVRNK